MNLGLLKLNYQNTAFLVCLIVAILTNQTAFGQCGVNAGNDVTICSGQSVTLGGNPISGIGFGNNPQYDWDNGAADIAHPIVSPNQTTTYTVDVSGGGCFGNHSDQITVTVISALLASNSTIIFNGQQYFYKCTSTPPSNIFIYNDNPGGWDNLISHYDIDWGDGSPHYNSNNDNWSSQSNAMSHSYAAGVYTLIYTVTGPNNCTTSESYNVFVGNTPAVGLNSPGNTEGCTPISLTFPITNVSNNVPGTLYTVTFSDDGSVQTFNHPPPATVTHNFNHSSCGYSITNGSSVEQNAFGVTIQASNPCGTSNATVSPIRLSEPPTSTFTLVPTTACTGEIVTITNTSDPGSTVTGATCQSNAKYFWSITPTSGWTLGAGQSLGSSNGNAPVDFDGWATGSNALNVNFSQPGTYTVTHTIANGCGQSQSTQTVCIINPPTCQFTATPSSGCAPLTVATANTSTPPQCNGVNLNLQYTWSVTVPTGGSYTLTSGTLTSLNPTFNFTNTTSNTLTYTINLQVAPINPQTGAAMTTCVSNCSHTVVVYPAPVISTNPTPTQTICTGGIPSVLNVAYQYGTGTPTYQWYSNTTNSNTGGTLITGATSSSYTPPALTTVGSIYYYCVISLGGTCGTISSNPACVSVVPDPTITTQPTSTQTICSGGTPTALSIVSANGTGSVTYQWFSNTTASTSGGTPIANSNSATYSPPTLTTIGNYYYYATATYSGSGCGPATSALAQVTVIADPVINISTTPATYCQNSTASAITATVTGGNGTATYQWYSNISNTNSGGTAVAGATVLSFTPSTAVVGTQYYYLAVTQTTSGCGPTPSATVQVDVIQGPSVSTNPQPSTVCVGGTPTQLSVAYTNGTGTATYQWYQSATSTVGSGTAISGATSPTYSSPATTAGTVYYYCTISFASGGCSSINSNSAAVTVTPDPSISANPTSSQSVCVGATIPALTIATSGGTGTISYQWYSNTTNSTTGGQIISGATSTTYTPPVFNTAGSYYYYATVSMNGSGCGNATSAIGEVIVVVDPTITTSALGSQSICQNATATALSVTASGGTGTFSYQWYSNSANNTTSGTAISGATQATYTPPTSTVATQYYYCVISQTGLGCQVVSATATVVVNAAPTFTTNPQPSTVCVGGTPTQLSVAYSNGTGTATYQWYQSATSTVGSGTAISGATSATYSPPSTAVGTVYYYCTISFTSGGCSSINSNSASVTVTPDPSISANPTSSQSVCVGATIPALTIATSGGTGTISYQWYSNTTNSTTGGQIISGATSTTYTPPVFNTAGSFFYYATVSMNGSGCGNATSAIGEVIVVVDPTITTSALSSQSLCQNATATALSVTASGGTGTFSYQWYSNSANNTTSGTAISGATQATYTPPTSTVATQYYYCVISQTGLGCQVVSTTATVVVNAAPTFTTNPQPSTVCVGGTPTQLSVAYSNGTGTATYQWYQSATSTVGSGTAISGATSATYSPPASTVGTAYYYCTISFATGGCSSINSSSAAVTVINDPSVNLEPLSDQTICEGGLIAPLSIGFVDGTGNATYQWYSNSTSSTSGGSVIAGATNASYQPPVYNTTGNNYYYAIVTLSGSGCGTATSSVAHVGVVADPTISAEPIAQQSLCQGASVSDLAVSASGGTGSFSYAWYSNTVNTTTGSTAIVNQNSATYTPPSSATGTLYYYCIVSQTGLGCQQTSTISSVTINPAPTFVTQPIGSSVCQGGLATTLGVTYTNGAGSATYQWYQSQTSTGLGSAITGATQSTYLPSTTAVDTLFYYCVIGLSSGGCASITSNVAEVQVSPGASVSSQPIATQSMCEGGIIETALSVAYTGGSGTPSYQWYLSPSASSTGGTAIAGANQDTYTPPAINNDGTYHYYVVITLGGSGCGSATSNTAAVVVVNDPAFDNGPLSSQSVCQGATTTSLSVTTSGGVGSFSYQWYSNGTSSNTGGTLLTGENSSSYAPPSSSIGNQYYYCEVTQTGHGCGSSSPVAHVLVNPAPTFTTNPVDETICQGGGPATLSVTYSNGTGTPSYQWFQGTTATNGTAITGANNSSYTPQANASAGATYYYCEIALAGGGCTSIQSSMALVTVLPDASQSGLLSDSLSCVGGTMPTPWDFQYTNGVGIPGYNWYFNTQPTINGAQLISGANTSSYIPPIQNTAGDYFYFCEMSMTGEGCDVLQSNIAHLQVIADPTLSSPIANQDLCQNAPAADLVISVSNGAGTTSYQWYQSTFPVFQGNPISGATSDTYTPSSAATGTVYYHLEITQSVSGCNAISGIAQVNVSPVPTVTTPPASQALCQGVSATAIQIDFVNGTGVPIYNWYQSPTDDVSTGTLITGEHNSVFTPSSTGLGTVYYYAELVFNTGGCPSILSSTFPVTVSPYPQLTFSGDTEICFGQSTNLSFIFTSPSGVYDMTLHANGQAFQINDFDGNTTMYEVSPTITTTYILDHVEYNGAPACAISPNAQVQVIVNPLPVMTMTDAEICSGELNVPIAVLPEPVSNTYSIQWQPNTAINFTPLNNSSHSQIVNPPNSVGITSTFYYLVSATNLVTQCVNTDSAAVIVHPLPNAGFDLPPVGCLNVPIVLGNASNGAGTFQWFIDGNPYSSDSDPIDPVFSTTGFHDISMTATTEFGCTDDTTASVEVIVPPTSHFTPSVHSGCAPLDVSFTNESTGQYVSYDWTLAPDTVSWSGNTSTLFNPAGVTYLQGDSIVNYSVQLIVSNLCGIVTYVDTIEVLPTPVAQFSMSVTDGCSPLDVDFFDYSVGLPDTYSWDFQNGNSSSLAQPGIQTFLTDSVPSTYTITLSLTNECGTDQATQILTVYPNTLDAYFEVGETFGCEPFTVVINDFVDPNLNVSYDFGNGDFVGHSDPTYTYQHAGNYTIVQQVTNGCSYVYNEVDITVYESPIPEITIVDHTVCDGDQIQFTGSSNTNGEYLWTLGDGTTMNEAVIEYAYSSAGNYDITLEVTSPNGCSATVNDQITVYPLPEPIFNVVSQVGCSPFNICFTNASNGSVFYEWNFGDGNVSASSDPCHTYYNLTNQPMLVDVTMTAIDMNLCRNSTVLSLIVSPTPTSAFALSGFESCYFPQTIQGTNFSIDAFGYEWTVNGVYETENVNASFVFDSVGVYTVSLVASNAYGCSNSSQLDYTIHPLPDIQFSPDSTEGCMPLDVEFTNLSNGATSYEWDFGDGITSTDAGAFHTYTIPGLFTVALSATTVDGCSDTLELVDLINVHSLPLAYFELEPHSTTILSPYIHFNDYSVDAVRWLWSFGDGSEYILESGVHEYQESGYFPINLTVWNQFGCKAEQRDAVTIQQEFIVYVPNTFTPQHDGTNEVFMPIINGKELIESYVFRITDRWGNVIFQTNDPDQPWIGDVRGGDYFAEDGAYEWQLWIQHMDSDKPYVKKGHVILLR